MRYYTYCLELLRSVNGPRAQDQRNAADHNHQWIEYAAKRGIQSIIHWNATILLNVSFTWANAYQLQNFTFLEYTNDMKSQLLKL
jgi:hypothetical protein